MICGVSSIQPESSTAPACRNISHGERASRAPAANAAAGRPSNGANLHPATSATRSIVSAPAPSTSRTSRTRPVVAPGTKAPSVATAGCSSAWVVIMTLSIDALYACRAPDLSSRRSLCLGAPQMLVEPRQDLDEIARLGPVIELGG